MTHFTKAEWMRYVEGELPSKMREEAENHLYLCDDCLQLYLQAATESESTLPNEQRLEKMTNQIMDELQMLEWVVGPNQTQSIAEGVQYADENVEMLEFKQEQSKEPGLKNAEVSKPAEKSTQTRKSRQSSAPFYQLAIFHYTLAGVATIVLMMTGVFQNITHYTDWIQNSSRQQDSPSLTEGIVNKTFSWLDTFETNLKEANKK